MSESHPTTKNKFPLQKGCKFLGWDIGEHKSQDLPHSTVWWAHTLYSGVNVCTHPENIT